MTRISRMSGHADIFMYHNQRVSEIRVIRVIRG
jgi:hypothetical protein